MYLVPQTCSSYAGFAELDFKYIGMKFRFLIAVLVTGLFMAACDKPQNDENDVLNRVNEEVSGYYKLEFAMRLDQIPMDLDGNGVKSADLVDEFVRLPLSVTSMFNLVYIPKAFSFDVEREFMVSIPVQYLKYTSSGYDFADENNHGGSGELRLSYKVNKDGSVSYTEDTISLETGLETVYGERGIDIMDTKFLRFDGFGKPQMRIVLDAGYYDFAKSEYVKVPVMFVFNKLG